MKYSIAIINNDSNINNMINLDTNAYSCIYFKNMQSYVSNDKKFNVIVLSLAIKDIEYSKFFEKIEKNTPIILLATYEQIKLAEDLIKKGFYNFIELGNKDSLQGLGKMISDSLNGFKLKNEDTESFFYLSKMNFSDKKVREMVNTINKVSQTDIPMLLYGEHGIGKEVIARAIHHKSKRADKSFVVVNCAILQEDNIEKILFGYINPLNGKYIPGKFELADGGTIYFDEITELKMEIQSKIFRVLQYHEVEPLGSNETINVNFRVIASTNKKIEDEIKEGRFKEELYFRINTFVMNISPLRERKADIPILANEFLKYYNAREGKHIKSFSIKALNLLTNYSWPGNIRELKNAIFRAISLTDHDILDSSDFSFIDEKDVCLDSCSPLTVNILAENNSVRTFKEIELEVITKVINFTNGNISAAAKMLNIGRATFYRKLDEINAKE